MQGKFTEEDKKLINKLYKNGKKYHEISTYFLNEKNINVSDDCIRKIIKRTNKKKQEKKTDKVLVLSDLHIPHQRDDILDIVKQYKNKISTIILAGDIIDCESISVFKSVNKYKLIDEMCITYDFLKELQSLTHGIKRYMFLGNHEDRFKQYLSKHPSALTDLHTTNILQEIVDGFYDNRHLEENNLHKYKKSLNYEVINNWYMQYNDLVICHPKSFSKVQGKTAVNACEYLVRNGFNFNVIYVAHTHKQAIVPNLGKWCAEIGCLCKDMEYQNSGKLTWTPIMSGYAVAVFNNKKYDLDKSKVVHLD